MPRGEHRVELALAAYTFGSEAEGLDFAEQHLKTDSFQALVTFVLQRYIDISSLRHLPFYQGCVVAGLYAHWCRAFKYPEVTLFCDNTICVCTPGAPDFVNNLGPHQIEALRTLGWSTSSQNEIRLSEDQYAGSTVQDTVKLVLSILEPTFKSLPPIKTRYERLMGDPSVEEVLCLKT